MARWRRRRNTSTETRCQRTRRSPRCSAGGVRCIASARRPPRGTAGSSRYARENIQSASCPSNTGARCLPLEQIHFVAQQCFTVSEKRDDDPQPHGCLGRGVCNNENGEGVSLGRADQARERHQINVHGVQHQLDGHQNDDDVSPGHDADHTDGEQAEAQEQIMAGRNHRCSRILSFSHPQFQAGSRPSPAPGFSHHQTFFLAITTAPIMATSNRIDAISNGSIYSPNRTFPTSSVLGSSMVAGPGSPSGSPERPPAIATVNCAPSASASTNPSHHCRLNCTWCKDTSRLISMMTKTNSTMMPPAYKITCTINKNSACSCRKIPAVASSAVIKKIALCTMFRRVTTRTAEIMASVAKK